MTAPESARGPQIPRSEAGGAPVLEASDLVVSYGAREVLRGLSLSFDEGEFAAIIGPNGSGKSTLLRTLARLIRPQQGRIAFDGRDIEDTTPRDLAQRLAFLPQAPEGPADLTIEDLVWRGRYPHRGLFASASAEDRAAVERALLQAGVDELRHRALATLSGGERQRAWIAMSLSREPDLLLLDEPTTFLDIGHQAELLGLLGTLNRERGLTVVMVLHDVTQAAQYARRVIALHDGRVMHDGTPAEVVTAERISSLFDATVDVLADPVTGVPVVVPRAPTAVADVDGSDSGDA
ncbi:MAG TPA: ABC transporter ATP-binding protein [Dehalococcoidia bacterium]|nr:ABC transporter ATP-binding protein [Dehalococcoidia bacterium]